MTEPNQPSNQPPQSAPQQSLPPLSAPPPGYPNPPYGNPQYGNAPYGSYPQYGSPQYGSYGPYNPGPYGYPQGYYGQPLGTNGMAIASLILGICGFLCVTPFVGLGLGIAALSRINKTGQPGKGLAIAGVILSSLWILLMILLLATGNFHFGVGSNTGPSVGPTQDPNGRSA